jgi:hypothetical protein
LAVATFRCDAHVWTLLEVKRTLRALRRRVDPTRLTHLGHSTISFAVMHNVGILTTIW